MKEVILLGRVQAVSLPFTHLTLATIQEQGLKCGLANNNYSIVLQVDNDGCV